MSRSTSSPLILQYIDVRSLSDLPLISSLRPEDQDSVRRFHFFADQRMALASHLLKYLFIHSTARVPWSEVAISRTPAPHKRPIFVSPPSHPAVEFNVSHQAGLVALLGCSVPAEPSSPPATDTISSTSPSPLAPTTPSRRPQLGIDITSPTEIYSRRANPPRTEAAFAEHASHFDSAFSDAELAEIQYHPIPMPPFAEASERDFVAAKMRRFSAFWALKEAYLKMTGEALVADWLRELEFQDVVAPEATDEGSWTEPPAVQRRFAIRLRGQAVADARMELRALGADWIVATCVRGLKDYEDGCIAPVAVDLEGIVRACAEGRCSCLSSEPQKK